MIANPPVKTTLRMTPVEFEPFSMLPENLERHLELIDGEVIEMVSNNYPAETIAILMGLLASHVYGNKLGRLYAPEAGFRVNNNRVMPDISFLSLARQPEPSHETWNSKHPDLAVEVLSPTDRPGPVRRKLAGYLAAGTTTWIVNPEEETVEVYIPGVEPVLLGVDDLLDGGTLLPGFSIKVADIFPK